MLANMHACNRLPLANYLVLLSEKLSARETTEGSPQMSTRYIAV